MNVAAGGDDVLINDPANPPGVVKAWYPIACRSAGTVTGPYTVDPTAVNVLNTVDLLDAETGLTVIGQMVTGGTFTIPISGATRFYRLDGPRQTRITSVNKTGANLVVQYQVQ